MPDYAAIDNSFRNTAKYRYIDRLAQANQMGYEYVSEMLDKEYQKKKHIANIAKKVKWTSYLIHAVLRRCGHATRNQPHIRSISKRAYDCLHYDDCLEESAKKNTAMRECSKECTSYFQAR